MIIKGGIKLDITEEVWEHNFKTTEDKKRAEKILQTLAGMSVLSAKEFLIKCGQCLENSVIGYNE